MTAPVTTAQPSATPARRVGRLLRAAATAALLATACGDDGQTGPESAAPLVRIAPVTVGEAVDYFRTTGEVVARDRVALASEVPGQVAEIRISDGARVRQGDVLIRLDTRTEEAALAAAEASLDERRQEFERVRELFAEGFAEEARVDQVAARFEQARADVQGAREALENKILEAPFSGQVGFILVSPGDFVAAGDPLLEIASIDALRIRFTVPQNLQDAATRGKSVQVLSSDGEINAVNAEILTVSQLADPNARSFEAEARLPDGSSFRPGEFVRVDLPTAIRSQALFVPEEALLRRTASAFVFRVGGDGKLQRIEVGVGMLKDGSVEIRGPLTAGDQVVVSSHQNLRDGIRVTTGNDEATGESGTSARAPAAEKP